MNEILARDAIIVYSAPYLPDERKDSIPANLQLLVAEEMVEIA